MNPVHLTYIDLFKKASASEEVSFVKEAAGSLRNLLLLSGVGLTSGLLGTSIGRQLAKRKAEEEAQSGKALTFGAGLLSGLLAPAILGKLKNIGGSGLTPGYYDEFTEF